MLNNCVHERRYPGSPTNTKKKIATAAILTLAIPTKPNHVFLGWATDSASKSVAYTPGSTYTAEEDVTLYAIWQERNYDFSASGLAVTPSEIEQYGKMTVKFRLDSWDRNLPYEDNINGRQHIQSGSISVTKEDMQALKTTAGAAAGVAGGIAGRCAFRFGYNFIETQKAVLAQLAQPYNK